MNYCAECEYSFSTSTPATVTRGHHYLCQACAAERDAATQRKQVVRLQRTVTRLRRELTRLSALPALVRADYTSDCTYRKAVTTRNQAIAQRRIEIADYEREIERLQLTK